MRGTAVKSLYFPSELMIDGMPTIHAERLDIPLSDPRAKSAFNTHPSFKGMLKTQGIAVCFYTHAIRIAEP